jgi:hypothetical protein
MGLLGTPKGIFNLDNSDKFVGSYIAKLDLMTILNITNKDLINIPFENNEGVDFIDEKSLRNYWQDDKIPNSPPYKIGNSSVSFDEYILVAIIKKTFPNSTVEQQIKWGQKYIDIKLTLNNKEYFIEFHGPGHFKQLSAKAPEDPFLRKVQIEKDFGITCFIWPYWIQRCSKNLKVLLGDKKENGYGALWSTKIHFGQFYFHNSYDIIKEITNQFNAAPNENYGYFYEENGVNRYKPEHPIVKSILNGRLKDGIDRILPKGISNNKIENWLPDKLKKYRR